MTPTQKLTGLIATLVIALILPLYIWIEPAQQQKNLEELHIIHRRLSGLDAFFKTEMPRDLRKQVRGIKNDLAALKNTLHNANQKRHDYVSKKEELEQLKRLGVNKI